MALPIWLSDLFIAKKAKNVFLAFFAIKRSSFGQPDSHIGGATSMPFTSTYPKVEKF